MIVILGKAALFSAIVVSILLLYCIISEIISSIRSRKDIRNKEYLKDFFRKLFNTILIFYPIFLIMFGLICTTISKF